MHTAPQRKSLSSFWSEHAFTVGATDFLQLDVALGAMARGDWAPFERRLAEGLACIARAEADHVQIDPVLVDEAATAFRYERDLIAGADMDAWLDQVGLSTSEWIEYITRDILRQMWMDDLSDVIDRWPPSARQLQATAVAEGICSGDFDALGRAFAGRTALAAEADERILQMPDAPPPAIDAEASRLSRVHGHWLSVQAPVDVRGRLIAALCIEDGFRAAAERLTSEDILSSSVEARRIEWSLLDLETMSFRAESAAREALLCLREDGLSMEEISILSRQPVRRVSLFWEDLPADQRTRLVSAAPGQILGPIAVNGHHELARVVSRVSPGLHDERVAERARRAAIDAATARAARERVKRRTLNPQI